MYNIQIKTFAPYLPYLPHFLLKIPIIQEIISDTIEENCNLMNVILGL
ncbi:13759_t:CDS:2 [Gigaspora margarita]|uniref:13759_t:CDS:1 n=1 Tax=Gigaspora margarita TaxID=4874 RepID=A0ABN7UCF9_GIGMA|nr:13759_t:CDS:2 [Gigaspora margarita]